MDIIKDTAKIKGDKDGFAEDERLHEDINEAIGFKIVMEEEAEDAAKKKVTGVEEEEKKDDLVHTQSTANKNETELNVFEVHDKPECAVNKEKENAEHLNKANSKTLQNAVNVKILRDIQQKQEVERGKMKPG